MLEMITYVTASEKIIDHRREIIRIIEGKL